MSVHVKQEGRQSFTTHTFGYEVMQEHWPKIEAKFDSLDEIAKEVGASYKVLAMLTSSVMVGLKGVPGFEAENTNLGLQLKSKGSKVQIADFVQYEQATNSYYFRSEIKLIIK